MDIGIIHVKGIDLLSEKEKQLITHLLNEYSVRIQRQIKNITSFNFDLKKYEKTGKMQKFSVHARVKGLTGSFEADYGDWDLARTIHKVFNKLMNEIEKRLHISDQHLKTRKPQIKRIRK